ncbi:MAG: DNA-directed RNA polymerase subunit omega [Prevotellaceae bacterium]|jgi:DNA-directed RNA polymerase subunit K/omega|nr:DNA-directed RNA polymerase subunit omega [Prevotellaceae bacterium]
MEYKRFNAPGNTVTRNVEKFTAQTGNIYESVMIIAKRANQISAELKQELSKKLDDFSSVNDNLEETFENREQIEMSKYYERLPKASLLAVQEFTDGKIYYRKAESTK